MKYSNAFMPTGKTSMTPHLCSFLLGVLLSFPSQAATLTGRVVKVSDGDTITVLEGTIQHKIRLLGIDAPERNQPFGNRSKQALANNVAGKTVAVEYKLRDKQQQILGKVIYMGYDINLRQLELGMAWHYQQHAQEQADQTQYAQAAHIAQRDKIGLWSYADSVAPWKSREAKKTK